MKKISQQQEVSKYQIRGMKIAFIDHVFSTEDVADSTQSCLDAYFLNKDPKDNYTHWVQKLFILTIEEVIKGKYPRIKKETTKALEKFADENVTIEAIRIKYGILQPLKKVEHIEMPEVILNAEEKVNLVGIVEENAVNSVDAVD